jgi:prepilin-type N-terminal cleavage/methylation domain-containing protein
MAGLAPRNRNQRSSGFSLYELMIAVGILLVAVLAALQTQATSLDLVQTTRETDTATSDLQAAMEQILLRSPDQIPIAGSPYEAGQPIAAFNDLHLRGERMVPTYPNYAGGPSVPDPLQIELTVTWNDFKGRPRTMRIASTRTR